MTPLIKQTERLDPLSRGIDARSNEEALQLLFEGQRRALAAVERSIPQLSHAADMAVEKLAGGGRLLYLAAGSPALIALGDALEIPQTFGEPGDRFVTVLAGGEVLTTNFVGGFEDDGAQGIADIRAASVCDRDCVVAISASGSTPYVLEGLKAARDAGAATVAIANNADVPLLDTADLAVLLDTGPEVIAGSTRMGAGTAQKAALNMLSTLIAIRRGHIHDGHMVGVRADNAKLRERAARIVCDASGLDPEAAAEMLAAAQYDVKVAILLANGAETVEAARRHLSEAGGRVRDALIRLAGKR